MKRSEVLTQCLINSGCGLSDTDIRHSIFLTFTDEYPNKSYDEWDIEISDNTANHIIKTVGPASWIKVDLFIRNLCDAYLADATKSMTVNRAPTFVGISFEAISVIDNAP